jgi:hydroxymethylpyrimidine/phosphomethylpyrimidine kinase
LKTFAALGVYGSSALTAVTAQNTLGVFGVQEISPEVVAAQIDAVVADIGADATKTGMLSSAPIIAAVADRVRAHDLPALVVDPVMVAKSGDRLLRADAVAALRELLLPLAALVTPNIPEAEALVGRQLTSDEDLREAARTIADLGARAVLIKGGHRPGDADDLLYDGLNFQTFHATRLKTQHTHGTGCTLSAAIAAYLARGRSLADAVDAAKQYLTGALAAAYPIGAGHSPVHHFYQLWTEGAGR